MSKDISKNIKMSLDIEHIKFVKPVESLNLNLEPSQKRLSQIDP